MENEERIQNPMEPNCEVSLVIPVYGERDYIFRPLSSLVEQEGVNTDQYEAIFVINNPGREPKQEEKETEADLKRKLAHYYQTSGENGENQQVLNIIRFINGENVEVDLSEEEEKIVHTLQEKGVRIYAIDKSSPGKILPEEDANVGGARNRGLAEAVARFYEQKGENGIVAQTDADSRLDREYIRNIIQTYKDYPEYIGVGGELTFENTEGDDETLKRVANYSEMKYRYKRLLDFLINSGVQEKDIENIDKQVAFSGANMSSRAYEAAIVDGVPKKGGGEDPEFGYRLAEIGKIEHVDIIKTMPADRKSPRTAVWAGHGQNKIKILEAFEARGTVEVEDLERAQTDRDLREKLKELFENKSTDVDELRKIFTTKGVQLLSDEKLSLLSKKLGEISKLEELATDSDLDETRHELETARAEIMPLKPIEEVAPELINRLKENDTMKKKYEAILKQLKDFENEWVKNRHKTVKKLLKIIFEDDNKKIDDKKLMRIIEDNKRIIEVTDEGVEGLRHDKYVLIGLADCISKTESEEEAFNLIRSKFRDQMLYVEEDNEKQLMLQLKAMHQAKREL